MGFHAARRLLDHGLILPAPDAVWVQEDVRLERLSREGVVLHPGVRIAGADTVICRDVEIGTHGSVVLKDVALGRGVKVASGYAECAALLDGAALGPDAHVRGGTILEEGASTGHSVGLKQSILMAFATLGSQINFCDVLLSGGRSRSDHSEVGSGFIHFNYTPFGPAGDKATASLFGDVPHGVLLDRNRVFLGGSGGVVGPVEVGFGTVLAAGFVYRHDQGEDLLVLGEPVEPRTVRMDFSVPRRVGQKTERTVRYVAQLVALAAWYRDIRVAREHDPLKRAVLETARRCLDSAIDERLSQVDRMLAGAALHASRRKTTGIDHSLAGHDELRWSEFKDALRQAPHLALPEALVSARDRDGDHVSWLRGLTESEAKDVNRWLGDTVDAIRAFWKAPTQSD